MGWEPTERHEHYDADGALTGVTVVTREAEWSDEDRDDLLGLALYEAGVCECGYHQSLTSDPTNRFSVTADTCNVCAAIAVHARVQHEADQQVERAGGVDDKPDPRTRRPTDGQRISVRQAPPGG